MGKIIAISNLKGGVGKTTTAINLSSSLALLGHTVLLVDADPQANASLGLGVENPEFDLYQLLTENISTARCINKTANLLVDIIPSSIALARLQLNPKESLAHYVLKEKLHPIKENYDFIIIDSPTALGAILMNIFTACDSVMMVVQCEYFAFSGLNELFRTLKFIKAEFNTNIDIEGILITMYHVSTKEHGHITEHILEHFQGMVFHTKIARSIKLAEATSYGKSIVEYDIKSSGAMDYLQLAQEILPGKKIGSLQTKGSLSDTLKEDLSDLDFLLALRTSSQVSDKALGFGKFDSLMGCSKRMLMKKLGLMFNDMNSNVWMYRISDDHILLKKKYLYLIFDREDKVIKYQLRRSKVANFENKFSASS